MVIRLFVWFAFTVLVVPDCEVCWFLDFRVVRMVGCLSMFGLVCLLFDLGLFCEYLGFRFSV